MSDMEGMQSRKLSTRHIPTQEKMYMIEVAPGLDVALVSFNLH